MADLSPDDVTRLRGLVADGTFTARFELEREIGAGGMGRVFIATEKADGKQIAIKLLDFKGDTARFAAEAEILESLEHPAIVSYVAHGVTTDGRAYLAMTWLAGESLATRLLRGPIGALDAVLIGARVADALAYLHARKIIHRDIKPSNVFLVGNDPAAATVIDLGIAKQLDASEKLTRTGQLIGTPGYMAPEQVMGESTIDGRVDLFALGCLLHEALCGEMPFPGEAVMEVLARLLLHDPKPIDAIKPEVPARLATLVAILLAKDADDRTIDAAATAIELSAIAAALVAGDAKALATSPFSRPVAPGAPTMLDVRPPAGPASDAKPTPRARGSRLVPVIAVVAPLVAIAVIATLMFMSRPGPAPPPSSVERIAVAVPPMTLPAMPAELARTPGPLVSGRVVDAADPDQLGVTVRRAVWCKPRDRVVLLTEDNVVRSLARDRTLETIATLPAQPEGEKKTSATLIACLADRRILVVARGYGYVIDGSTPSPPQVVPEHIDDGVALGTTARWVTPDGIFEWHGGMPATRLRAACAKPLRLSPNGERVACSEPGGVVVDDGHTKRVGPSWSSVTWSADGTALYTSTGGASYRWRVDQPAKDAELVGSGSNPIEVGAALVTTISTGLAVTKLRSHQSETIATTAAPSVHAAIPEHGEIVVALGGQGLRIVALAKPDLALRSDRHYREIRALGFSADGASLVSLGGEPRIVTRAVDASARRTLDKPAMVPGVPRLLWRSDGRIALLGAGVIPVWDRDGKTSTLAFENKTGSTTPIAGTDGVVCANEKGIQEVPFDGSSPKWLSQVPVFRAVRDVEVDKASRFALLEAGPGFTSAKVVELASGRTVIDLAEPTDRMLQNAVLVTGDVPTLVVADAKRQVFVIRDAIAVPFATFAKSVAALAASPVDRRVAIAAGREVIVLDVDSRRELARAELASDVTALAWDRTGKRLAVASKTTEIRVFDVP